jgi:cytoskeletal protein CcmA (bactofilin family)
VNCKSTARSTATSAARLVVGKDGAINGCVTADEVIVRGGVNGVIRAHRVTLLDSARVESDIFHKTLTVEAGACFQGQVRFREDPIDAEVQNHQIAELQDVAATMQSAVCDPANEPTIQSAAKVDPAPNEAFQDEMDRLRTRLRKIG